MIDMKKTGERIGCLRQEKGMTQITLAEALGITSQAISKWERELCYPDITILPDLARVLGCTVNDFFEECDT